MTRKEPKYRVTLISGDPVQFKIVGSYESKVKAFAVAKRAAGGRGVKFVTQGIHYGYTGRHGHAAITQ
jgi:hypothetical protein